MNHVAANHHRPPVLVALVSLAALAVLGFESARGLNDARALALGEARTTTLSLHAWLQCMDQRLTAILPVGVTVFFDPDFYPIQEGLVHHRLTEMAFPRFQQVGTATEAEFVLRVEESERPSSCDGVSISAEPTGAGR